MTITLRELATGKPLGADDVVHDRHGRGWIVDSWSPSTAILYLKKPGKPHEAVSAWLPSEVACYIGHERGQPISDIKWSGRQQFRSLVQFTDEELLDVHMALRYLRDHGCEGSTLARVLSLIAKIGKLPGHV